MFCVSIWRCFCEQGNEFESKDSQHRKTEEYPGAGHFAEYMFERLLVCLSASEYKEKFVLKGGMLVAAIVGLDNRATMDLDTTLKNLSLTPETICGALEQICATPFDDGVVPSVKMTFMAVIVSC